MNTHSLSCIIRVIINIVFSESIEINLVLMCCMMHTNKY